LVMIFLRQYAHNAFFPHRPSYDLLPLLGAIRAPRNFLEQAGWYQPHGVVTGWPVPLRRASPQSKSTSKSLLELASVLSE